MRKLFYFLAFLFIACVACDSKNEPVPPVPPEPIKPKPISPQDSINRLLEGIWEIDTVETFNYGKKIIGNEYVLIGYSKIKYAGNEQLKLNGWMYRKENNEDYFSPLDEGWYGMKGDTAYVYSIEYRTSWGYITYHYSNKRARIYKTEIKKVETYGKDSIISVHRRVKPLPK